MRYKGKEMNDGKFILQVTPKNEVTINGFTKEDLAFFYKEGEVQKYHDIPTEFETVFQSFISRKLNQNARTK